MSSPTSAPDARYEIRFISLFEEGLALSFPCNAQGQVDMDALSERARHNYLYARAVMGRQYAFPKVLAKETALAAAA